MIYRPEVDGLRAVAVIPVILFHAGFSLFSGGFVGVDIFFVISGYLITSILIEDLQHDRFSIVNFYERRARRILPSLFVVLMFCLLASWFIMIPDYMKEFSKSLIGVSFFSSNLVFLLGTGYFSTAAELKPLLHTWSLAVEEQFYIFFPIILFLLWKTKIIVRNGILATIMLGSFYLAVKWSFYKPEVAFFMLPTRAWEILVGVFSSVFYNNRKFIEFRKKHPYVNNLDAIGLLCIVISILCFDNSSRLPGIPALLPTIGTMVIIVFSSGGTAIGRLLSNRIFVGFGLISYSAYLWHNPLFSYTRHLSLTEPTVFTMSFLSCLTILLAYLSWRFIERPFRKVSFLSRKSVFRLSLAFLLGFSVFGIIGYDRDGFSERFIVPDFVKRHEYELPKTENGYCFYSIGKFQKERVGDNGLNCFDAIGSDKAPKILVFGDSFAGQYSPFWRKIGSIFDITIHNVSTNWCFPSFNDDYTGPKERLSYEQCKIDRSFVKENFRTYDAIVLSGHWADIIDHGFEQDVFDVIDELLQNQKLVFVMSSPVQLWKNSVKRSVFDQSVIPLITKENRLALKFEREIQEKYKEKNGVHLISKNVLFGKSDRTFIKTDDGYPYSLEGTHLSIYGAKKAADNFLQTEYKDIFLKYLSKDIP